MVTRSPEPPVPPEEGKPPDGSAGSQRASGVFSSPNGKKDREIQQPKKKVRPLEFPEDKDMNFEVVVEDITKEEIEMSCDQDHHVDHITHSPKTSQPQPMAWGVGRKKLFSEAVMEESWYIADSDSEYVAEAMREDNQDDLIAEDDDPCCPTVYFSPS
ncbi:unnamed protein product [Linum trigynum]|uniref:Uncharacterized protein n=1 Tax=Linum trigynum TaxID=586398 RepID=A0AAV2GIN2_9ROSI